MLCIAIGCTVSGASDCLVCLYHLFVTDFSSLYFSPFLLLTYSCCCRRCAVVAAAAAAAEIFS